VEETAAREKIIEHESKSFENHQSVAAAGVFAACAWLALSPCQMWKLSGLSCLHRKRIEFGLLSEYFTYSVSTSLHWVEVSPEW